MFFCVCQVDEARFQGVLDHFLSCPICESTGPHIRVMVIRAASTESDFVDRTQALFDRVARELLLEIPKMRW
jgi:hypothetical protein